MHTIPAPFLFALVLCALPAFGAENPVTIVSPQDGARLGGMAQAKMVYEVIPVPDGDHVHVYVDGKQVALLRQLKGTYALEDLAPGNHDICIKVVNKAHTPVGAERCIQVMKE